jgi:hypothetical protein
MAVVGQVADAVSSGNWRLDPDGAAAILPGVGGITYNCKVGDSALDWQVDHVEPGVSVKNENPQKNTALNVLACIGNVARVVSGDAKGGEGVVTGKHGGVEHVLVDFPDAVLDGLVVGDKVQIRAWGLGLELTGVPEVCVMNLSPPLLKRMAPRLVRGDLRVDVAHTVPAPLMGSGVGRSHTFTGDCDLQLFADGVVTEHGLAGLRLGDLVAVRDVDFTYGRSYRPGAVSIGVVVHCCCTQSGHGPGLTALMSSSAGRITPATNPRANVADYLRVGARRPAGKRSR